MNDVFSLRILIHC